MSPKSKLRKKLQAQRQEFVRSHTKDELWALHCQMNRLFKEAFCLPPQSRIGGYSALPYECNPDLILRDLHQAEHTLCLPIVHAHHNHLTFHEWIPGQDLYKGPYHIRQPLVTAPQHRPNVLILPALGFDRQGGRLVYGKGYYDTTLSHMESVMTILLAYSSQECQFIPCESHDQTVDWIVTEKEIIKVDRL